MNPPKLKENITTLYSSVKTRSIRGLRELNNVFTQDLMIYQDPLYLDLSLVTIVLAKMIEKPRFWRYKEWKNIIFTIEAILKESINLCDSMDKKGISKNMKKILTMLGRVDKRDMRYVGSMVEEGRIKVGSTLYAQGMSLGNAAFLSGAPKDAILKYSGKTLISDRFGKTISLSERLRGVKPIFRD